MFSMFSHLLVWCDMRHLHYLDRRAAKLENSRTCMRRAERGFERYRVHLEWSAKGDFMFRERREENALKVSGT